MRPILKIPDALKNHKKENEYYFTTLGNPSPIMNNTGSGSAVQLWSTAEMGPFATGSVGTFQVIAPTINMVELGNGPISNRHSRTILVKRIQAKFWIETYQNSIQAVNTQKIAHGGTVKIQIILDKQFNGAAGISQASALVYSKTMSFYLNELTRNITNSSSILSAYDNYSMITWPNRAYEQRFIILKEIVTTFNPQALISVSQSGTAFNALSWRPPPASGGQAYLPSQPAQQASWAEVDIDDIEIPITFDDTQNSGTNGNLAKISNYNIMVVAYNLLVEPQGFTVTQTPLIGQTYRLTFTQARKTF